MKHESKPVTIPGFYTPLTGFPARKDITLKDLNESGLEAPVSGDATTIESAVTR